MDVSNWLQNGSPYNQLHSPDLISWQSYIFSINLWFLVWISVIYFKIHIIILYRCVCVCVQRWFIKNE